MSVHEIGDFYVCISHQVVAPCDGDGAHLISNWRPDVDKILKIMKERENG